MSAHTDHQRDASSSEMFSMDEVFLRRLKEVINANLGNPNFGVDELGREVGMSRSQIHRKLKETVGQSASRFIRSYKLQKAKTLLEKKVGRVAEISDQLGFSSPAYFSQVFTEEFGLPPSAAGKIEKEAITPPKEPSDKTIAVLPFQNLSHDPENEYFSDGITEDIIAQLAKMSDLKVISRTSIMLYKHTNKNLKRIAKELGVATILEGSVRKSGNQVRITAQLINAKTDIHVWSATFDREIEEIFQIQSEVAQLVAQNLEAQLTDEEIARIEVSPTHNTEAYELLLKGRALQYTYTRANLYRAIEIYQMALAIDPELAEAYARLGWCHLALGTWIGDVPTQIACERAEPYLGQALLLDTNLAVTHWIEAYHQFLFKKNFSLAEKKFLLAYQLDPSDIINISGYQNLLNCTGRFEESLAWWEKGNQVAPFSFWNYPFKGMSYFHLGREDEAVDFYRHALSFIPHHPMSYLRMGWILYNTGKYAEAIQILEEGMEKFSYRHPSMLSFLALAYYQTGDTAHSNRIVDELELRYENNEKETAFFLGVYYSGIQQKEAALACLERSCQRNDVDLIWLKIEPQLRPLHGELRYQQLLRKVGFDPF